MSIEPVLCAAGLDHLLATGVTAHASALQVLLLAPGYTYSAAHTDLADLGANVVATSDTLTSVAVSAGYVTADDPTWPATTPGEDVAGYWVWDATHDYLLAYSGRMQDGRPIATTTSATGVDLELASGRLIRIGGAA